MSTISTSAVPAPIHTVSGALAGRELARLRRHPSTAISLLFLPTFFVLIWSSGFADVASLPGFPAQSLLDWIVPLAVLTGCSTSTLICGFAVARDIENGFFDRLLVAPVRPSALVVGAVLSGLGRAVPPFVVVTAVAFVRGATLPGGVGGLVALTVAAAGTSLCAAGWAVGLALRLGTVRRSVHLMQTGSALVLYLSTGLAPLSFMSNWLREVARVNPMTDVYQLARQGFTGPVTWSSSWPGLAVLATGAVLFTSFAVRGLRQLRS